MTCCITKEFALLVLLSQEINSPGWGSVYLRGSELVAHKSQRCIGSLCMDQESDRAVGQGFSF